MKNRIVKTATGWTLNGFRVRHGDRVRAHISGEWRDVTFWEGAVPMVVQQLGSSTSELAVGQAAGGLDLRWPDGAERAQLN